MFVIWGFKHYGKSYFNGLFRYNRRTVTQMQIGGEYLSLKWKYNESNQHLYKYFRYSDEDKISINERVDKLSSDDLLHHYTDLGIKTENYVIEDYLGYGKTARVKPKLKTHLYKNRELYPIYSDHGSVWENHFFNDLCDCDIFIPQTHPQLMSYERFIEHFKTCNNIVPYKSDIVDMCIQRFNLFESEQTNKFMKTNIKNVEDAYYTNKDLVFNHLDFFTHKNRNVEQQLFDLEIPFEYLDLDTHDYKMLCENEIPRKHGEVGVSKNTERYDFARRVIDEYIKTRGLTDFRLSGRVKDRI